MSDTDDPLFDRVVELCGFSAYVGPGAVRRSLAEGGCVGRAGIDDYRRALPALKRRLEVYVPEPEAKARIEQIERALDTPLEAKPRGKAGAAPEDETKWGKRRFGKTVAILQQARDGLEDDD